MLGLRPCTLALRPSWGFALSGRASGGRVRARRACLRVSTQIGGRVAASDWQSALRPGVPRLLEWDRTRPASLTRRPGPCMEQKLEPGTNRYKTCALSWLSWPSKALAVPSAGPYREALKVNPRSKPAPDLRCFIAPKPSRATPMPLRRDAPCFVTPAMQPHRLTITQSRPPRGGSFHICKTARLRCWLLQRAISKSPKLVPGDRYRYQNVPAFLLGGMPIFPACGQGQGKACLAKTKGWPKTHAPDDDLGS
ncbi:hypothetical protein BS50DRAFT_177715 [Corynespora cassiicola Philippines]|uniref:Uncharacterized protein n=1 Tax=Corynespora cassiicola Philippines TaxID=1448308 RepID=A0A2T2P5V8_CORCC|nr:hypothetical protein BS50DRAFT_177715 [Corynespora cassiicola Philippines]